MLNTQPQTDLEIVEETPREATLGQQLQKIFEEEFRMGNISFGEFFERAQKETKASLEELEDFAETKAFIPLSAIPKQTYYLGATWTDTISGRVSVEARNPLAAARLLEAGDISDYHHDDQYWEYDNLEYDDVSYTFAEIAQKIE